MRKKDIYIPHLNYTVRCRQAKDIPEGLHENSLAWVESGGFYSCSLYMNLKKKISPGDLAHELVHVLQFICLNRNINFTLEHEHMGYLMHWLMGQVLGYTWE